MDTLLHIIFEDSDLLVVNKPAGLVCHPTKHGPGSSLVSRVRLARPHAFHPQLVNRLDRETSGLVLVAKNPRAARELRALWEGRLVLKRYQAIVRGHVSDAEGLIDAPLGRDEASLVAIQDRVRADGLPSQTEYRLLRRFTRAEGDFTWLQVAPRTGRKHQIRIHLAHLGHPVVGDKLYGGDPQLYLDFVRGQLTDAQRRALLLPHQALHAHEVRFTWRGVDTVYQAPPEPWFEDFLAGRPTAPARPTADSLARPSDAA